MLNFENEKRNIKLEYDENQKTWSDGKTHAITVEKINGFFIDGKQVAKRAYIQEEDEQKNAYTISLRNFAQSINALNIATNGNYCATPKQEKSAKTTDNTDGASTTKIPLTINELAKTVAEDLPTECALAVTLYTLRTYGATRLDALQDKINALQAEHNQLAQDLEKAQQVKEEDAQTQYTNAVAIYKAQCEKREEQKQAYKHYTQAIKQACDVLGLTNKQANDFYKAKNAEKYALASAYIQAQKNEGK